MKRIAIVGGGISGLSVAYELARLGHRDFVLFEASGRLGGIVETVRRDGFVVECGPDSWVTEKPWARELAVELGLEAEVIACNEDQRRTYIQQGERLVAMPDGMRMMVPADLEAVWGSALFSESAKRAYAREMERADELRAAAEARGEDEDEPVAEFVRRHFGDEVAEKIAGPLLAGVFGGDVETLSAAAVLGPFLKMEREYGSLIVGLREQERRFGARPPVFTSLKSGLQTLTDGMAAAVPTTCLRLREPVLGLLEAGDHWEVTGAGGVEQFDAVVVATAVDVARDLLGSVDDGFSDLLSIDASSAIIAAFAFGREASAELRIPEGFGFLVPPGQRGEGGEAPLLACTFVNQKFSHRVPEGGVLLRAFYGGDSALQLDGVADAEVLLRARRQLSRVLGELPEAEFELVRRWPRSLPQYAVGHRTRVREIENLAGKHQGLRIAGNALHGVGLPDLVRHGRTIARELILH